MPDSPLPDATRPDTARPVGVVTGASSGIGRWIALGLVRANHHVVLVCRDPVRGRAVCNWIANKAEGASTELHLADLSLLHATQAAGQAIAAAHPRVAVLINNAGIFSGTRQVTAEGHESVLAVNHLAPHVLSDALEGVLQAHGAGRIVNVGSSLSDRATIDPADLELTRRWTNVRAYSQSKLALMLSTFARAERLRGTGVTANVVHPGIVATGLVRERGMIGLSWRLMSLFTATEQDGAETPLNVALGKDWADRTAMYAKNRKPARPNPRTADLALRAAVEAQTRALIARTLG